MKTLFSFALVTIVSSWPYLLLAAILFCFGACGPRQYYENAQGELITYTNEIDLVPGQDPNCMNGGYEVQTGYCYNAACTDRAPPDGTEYICHGEVVDGNIVIK